MTVLCDTDHPFFNTSVCNQANHHDTNAGCVDSEPAVFSYSTTDVDYYWRAQWNLQCRKFELDSEADCLSVVDLLFVKDAAACVKAWMIVEWLNVCRRLLLLHWLSL
jgi:hypothetical protein